MDGGDKKNIDMWVIGLNRWSAVLSRENRPFVLEVCPKKPLNHIFSLV